MKFVIVRTGMGLQTSICMFKKGGNMKDNQTRRFTQDEFYIEIKAENIDNVHFGFLEITVTFNSPFEIRTISSNIFHSSEYDEAREYFHSYDLKGGLKWEMN